MNHLLTVSLYQRRSGKSRMIAVSSNGPKEACKTNQPLVRLSIHGKAKKVNWISTRNFTLISFRGQCTKDGGGGDADSGFEQEKPAHRRRPALRKWRDALASSLTKSQSTAQEEGHVTAKCSCHVEQV